MPKKHCHSFTLIELLVVIAVIAILAGITIGGVKFAFANSAEAAIKSRFQAMEMALEEYKRDWGYYPIETSEADFQSRFLAPPGDSNNNNKWDSGEGTPYLEDYLDFTVSYKQTPSGAAMRYQYPGSENTEKYDLQAPGVDETIDTADDITNWTER